MDSVSVLLNIFRPKCEHTAELRTFRILNCSQLESRFFVIQQKKKKKKKILPTLLNVFFSCYPNHTIIFWPNRIEDPQKKHFLKKTGINLTNSCSGSLLFINRLDFLRANSQGKVCSFEFSTNAF